jgi:hypothetical protein
MTPLIASGIALAAAGVGWFAFVRKKTPSALAPGQVVSVPNAPSSAIEGNYVPLSQLGPDANSPWVPPVEQGYGEAVLQTYDPSSPSVKQNVQAFRYLGLSANLPSDVGGDAENASYKADVANFQAFLGLPGTGIVDANTQAGIDQQVANANADAHNRNVAAGVLDNDWADRQNALGAVDPRGTWSVSGVGAESAIRARHRARQQKGIRS